MTDKATKPAEHLAQTVDFIHKFNIKKKENALSVRSLVRLFFFLQRVKWRQCDATWRGATPLCQISFKKY